jgi:capsular exopolysaccharide synthesis family protein
VLRTNLRFITIADKGCNVIILTSFNPGSGKTFLTMNIAATLALKEEKILVIDGDMRHASASAYISSPKKGLSNYLSGECGNIDECITAYPGYENFDMLPAGTIPPNPTELLNSSRFAELMQEMRKRYSCILIDCPPVEIVADTHIIELQADHTLFVVRTGLLERSMLTDLEKMHEDKRFKNLAIILNGTYSHNHYYKFGYRYGYRYSYRYGYHNSYHYGYGQK